jgi:hypothetical protein
VVLAGPVEREWCWRVRWSESGVGGGARVVLVGPEESGVSGSGGVVSAGPDEREWCCHISSLRWLECCWRVQTIESGVD